jgi:hypothetical protein
LDLHISNSYILHSIVFSFSNTCINVANFALVFLANYARPTSIIGNTTLCFQIFHYVFCLTMHAMSWNVHYCIDQLFNIYIPTCFPNSKLFYMWILHVSCLTCGFAIIPMWVLHFEFGGPLEIDLDKQLLVLASPLK